MTRTISRQWPWLLACAAFACNDRAHAAGKLGVTDAWIPVAAQGAGMLAGYATLSNDGDSPLSILTTQSDTFRDATLADTLVVDGVARMRELHRIVILPGASVALERGAKHLVLRDPRAEIAVGDKVAITFLLADGTRVESYFDVLPADASAEN